MKSYFVRVKRQEINQFDNFCSRHNLEQQYLSEGIWQGHIGTSLYRIPMNHTDAMALKLTLDIDIMETQNG